MKLVNIYQRTHGGPPDNICRYTLINSRETIKPTNGVPTGGVDFPELGFGVRFVFLKKGKRWGYQWRDRKKPSEEAIAFIRLVLC